MSRPDGIDDQIAWTLRHPGTSPWLKSTLSEALSRDPVALLIELEILNHLLLARHRDLACKVLRPADTAPTHAP